MNELTRSAPWHLWVVGGLSLLWNLVGAASYTMTELGKLEEMGFPADQIAYFYGFPAWAVAFWALGVWGCVLGSLMLLLRRQWAVWAFALSIIGLAGTTFYEWGVADIPDSMRSTGNNIFALVIWAITFSLYLYARRMAMKSFLR